MRGIVDPSLLGLKMVRCRSHRRDCRACAAPELSEAERRFSDWCSAKRITSPALEVAFLSGNNGSFYRGVRATRPVAADVELFTVPLALCLHSLAPADWPCAGSTPAARLAIRLLQAYRAGPASEAHMYLSILPTPEETPALGAYHWAEEQLVADTQAYMPLLRLKRQLQQKDALARAPVVAEVGGGGADDALFDWAMTIVRTRAFEVAPGFDVLVPMLDMCNHAHTDPGLEWRQEGECMVVRTLRPLQAGEEVTTSYGTKDSDGFLLFGGFVPQGENPHDAVEVFPSTAAAATWWMRHRIAAVLSGVDGDGMDAATVGRVVDEVEERALEDGDEGASTAEQRRTGVCLGPDWQVDDRLMDLFETLASLDRRLGDRVADRAAVAAVRIRAAQCLESEWPTSIEHDMQLLSEAGRLDWRTAACVQYRLAKKRILEGYRE
jgi:SET domain